MLLDKEIIRYVEYSICEELMFLYSNTKHYSVNFNSFCSRLKDSLLHNNLSKRESGIFVRVMNNVDKEYCLRDGEIDVIYANFLVEGKWVKYSRSIQLMTGVNWKY